MPVSVTLCGCARQGLFVAEGRLLVRRLFETKAFPVRSVLVTPVALRAMEDVIDSDRCPIYVCEQRIMDDLAGFNFHRGCLALGERPAAIEPIDRLARACCLLALEGVGNPDNVGGLFRAAAALGGGGVLLDQKCADPLYRKAIRTSMGAVFCLPFSIADDWLSTIRIAPGWRGRGHCADAGPVCKTPRGTGARPLAGSAPRPLAWSRRTRPVERGSRGCDRRGTNSHFACRRLIERRRGRGHRTRGACAPGRDQRLSFFSIAVARSTSAVKAVDGTCHHGHERVRFVPMVLFDALADSWQRLDAVPGIEARSIDEVLEPLALRQARVVTEGPFGTIQRLVQRAHL